VQTIERAGEMMSCWPRRKKMGLSWLRVQIAAGALTLLWIGCGSVGAQGMPTASRLGDLQAGGGVVFGRSNYNLGELTLEGGTVYAAFDRKLLGAEIDFHQVNASSGKSVYEQTYEVGLRAHHTIGRLVPYAKVMGGRGVYNFPGGAANIAYNMYTFGGGADFRLRRSLNVRADYEYQTWPGFPLATLHPNLITVGVAYHWHE
jgi:hypothetical protein